MVFFARFSCRLVQSLLKNSVTVVLLSATSGANSFTSAGRTLPRILWRNYACSIKFPESIKFRMSDPVEEQSVLKADQDLPNYVAEADKSETAAENPEVDENSSKNEKQNDSVDERDAGTSIACDKCDKNEGGAERYSRRKPRKRKRKDPNLHVTFKRARLTAEDSMNETKYYFENGLRKVIPYDHKYNTFCKGRWVGKTLSDIYTHEFRLYPIEYYDKSIREGRLLINLEPAESLGQILRDNDLLTSVVHRHECPVSDAPIEIIADDDKFFVVNKPCSIPLHPAGRFRYNSLVSILAKELNKTAIHSIHRLDRMTSGICMFTKTKELAKKVHTEIRERRVEKEYVCRVVGDFTKFSLPADSDHRIVIEGDEVTVSEPMKVFDMKIGSSIVSRDEEAKDCSTIFKSLSTDGNTSVVSCKPKTGRTHQIRVHLQYLGFPITNDPMYNNPAWGHERFKLGAITKPLDQVINEVADMKKWSAILEGRKSPSKSGNIAKEGDSGDVLESTILQPPVQSEALKEAISSMNDIVPYRSDCEECKLPLSDPKPEELIMYLHALRYKGSDWEFETEVPKWASSDWVEGNDQTL